MGFSAVSKQSTVQRGVCKVCGDAADDPRATLCAEHRGNSKGNAEVVNPSSSGGGSSAATGASVGKWNDFSAKLLVVLTTFIGMMIVRGANVIDPDDDLADKLAMTNNEARAISKPFARFVAKTSFSAKHGAVITGNDDLIDAAIAGWDWWRRVQQETDKLRGVVRNREDAMRQTHRTPHGPEQPGPYYQEPPEAATDEGEADNGQAERQSEPPRGVYAQQPWEYDERGLSAF